MKNLIYQVWEGNILPGTILGRDNMKGYAERIGAEYWFDHDPKLAVRHGGMPIYYEWLNFLFDDRFLEYDKVAILDLDVYCKEDFSENIFDTEFEHFAVSEEPTTPKKRAKNAKGRIGKNNDECWAKDLKDIWNISLPRTKDNLLKVYNAGVVLVTREGILAARKNFISIKEYIKKLSQRGHGRFYCLDQNYMHANLFVDGIKFTELSTDWNNQIYFHGDKIPIAPAPGHGRMINDPRNKDTKFIHVQLSAADHWLTKRKLDLMLNRPNNMWEY